MTVRDLKKSGGIYFEQIQQGFSENAYEIIVKLNAREMLFSRIYFLKREEDNLQLSIWWGA